MSDILRDEDTLVRIREDVQACVADREEVYGAVDTCICAILRAGYRIVKPEEDWADIAAYEEDAAGFSDRISHSTGDRKFVLETIISETRDGHEIAETFTVPVSRADLIAELAAMKEPAE